jgi:hypothetical protein
MDGVEKQKEYRPNISNDNNNNVPYIISKWQIFEYRL